ncbi:condensation domain protein [Ostertagia ostertagi]
MIYKPKAWSISFDLLSVDEALCESSDGVGSVCIFMAHLDRAVATGQIFVWRMKNRSERQILLEEVSFKDSPTIKCLARIGIDYESIDRHETFTSMGLDSLQCAELEMALQSEFPSYSIPTGIAMTKNTVEEMDTYLMSCVVACEINNKDDDAYSGHVPLSPQQRGLVFMSELEPLTRAQFNEPVVFAMDAAIFDERRFLRVLNSIVMRHSVLRTKYYANGQTILSGTGAFFTCRKSLMDPQIFVKAPMDIKDSSMHVGGSHSVFALWSCLVLPPIAMMPSITIIMRKQYADYARHTVSFNHNERLAKWREKLNGREFQLLPTDKSRTSKRTYNGGFTQKEIPTALQRSLRELRQAANCTNFCILHAVLQFLIYKLRHIRFPDSFHPLKTKAYVFKKPQKLLKALDPSCTIVQYLSRLSAAIAEARSTDVPLDVLVSDLSIERDDNVLLVLDNVQPPPSENGIVLLDCPTQFAKYEQTWYFRTDGKSINICVEYNRDLFRPQTMENLVDRFFSSLKHSGNYLQAVGSRILQ